MQWRFKRGVEEQTKAFLDGFNEVVPLQWLQFFDEKELELMLCGMQELNASEWEKNTVYRNYTRNAKQIQWFWQVGVLVPSGIASKGGGEIEKGAKWAICHVKQGVVIFQRGQCKFEVFPSNAALVWPHFGIVSRRMGEEWMDLMFSVAS